jgi:hypothetical protein
VDEECGRSGLEVLLSSKLPLGDGYFHCLSSQQWVFNLYVVAPLWLRLALDTPYNLMKSKLMHAVCPHTDKKEPSDADLPLAG